MAWRPAEWLEPGTASAAPGFLEVDEGGLAFVHAAFAEPLVVVPGPDLARVGPSPTDRAPPRLVVVIEGAGGAVHRVRLAADDCRGIVAALVADRRLMGLPSVPVADADGAGPGGGRAR